MIRETREQQENYYRSAQAAFSRRLDMRQRDIERRMRVVEERSQLRDRLARLEKLATGGE